MPLVRASAHAVALLRLRAPRPIVLMPVDEMVLPWPGAVLPAAAAPLQDFDTLFSNAVGRWTTDVKVSLQQMGEEGSACAFGDELEPPAVPSIRIAVDDCGSCEATCVSGLHDLSEVCHALQCGTGHCTVFGKAPELRARPLTKTVEDARLPADLRCKRKGRTAFRQIGDDQSECSWRRAGEMDASYFAGSYLGSCE